MRDRIEGRKRIRKIGALVVLGIFVATMVIPTPVVAQSDNDWNFVGINSLAMGYPTADRPGNCGIGTDSPTSKLHVVGDVKIDSGDLNVDSGTLFVDNNNNRVGIGTTSPGAKLDVELDLYEGGAATIGHYQNSATGDFAVAMGDWTTASGEASTAMGWDTTASGNYSTAMGGWDTEASGDGSIAMGYMAEASGFVSQAIGMDVEASGVYSCAIGSWVTAGPAYSTYVIGRGADAYNPLVNNIEKSLMVGFDSTTPTLFVDGSSVGIGTTTPDKKLEIQDDTYAQLRLSNADAFYTDLQTTSSGYLYINPSGGRVGIEEASPSSTLDVAGTITGDGLVIDGTVSGTGFNGWDKDDSDDLTTSTGFDGDVSGTYNDLQLRPEVVGSAELASTGVTAGTYGSATQVAQITVDGDGRITSASNIDIIESDPQVGSISTNYVPKWDGSALVTGTIYDNGNVGIGYTGPNQKLVVDGKVGIGYNDASQTAKLAVNGLVGIGTTSPGAKLDVVVSSGGAATIGSSGNSATGDYAIALGYNSIASGPWSIAMGDMCTSSGGSSVAIGYNTNASGAASTAMGFVTTASGFGSTAMGSSMTVEGDYSFGISLEVGGQHTIVQSNTMAIMGGNVGIGTTSPGGILEVSHDGSAHDLFVDSNGNVGIGTISPGSRLEVNGNVILSKGSNRKIEIPDQTTGNVDGDSLTIEAGDAYGVLDRDGGNIILWPGKCTDYGLDGRVGIGTGSPEGTLHIIEDVSGGSSSRDAEIILEADPDNTDEYANPVLRLLQDGGNNGAYIGCDEDNLFYISRLYDGKVDGCPSDWSNTFTIDLSNGNIAIGSLSTHSEKLYVDGDFKATGSVTARLFMWALGKGFRINHTLNESKYLQHGALEGPEWGVIYRGNGTLVNGTATVYLPYYYDSLTMNNSYTVQLTARGSTPFTLSYDSFNETAFVVYGSVQTGEFDWEVKATRDDIDPLEVEPDKEES